LQEARAAGRRLAIATTTTPDNVTALLEHSLDRHAPGWFEVIGAGSVVPSKKPAPDIYQYVLDAMDAAPERCLAFEDSENGVRSARAAGVPTLVTVSEYSGGQDFSGAALVVDHLGEPDRPFTVLAGDAYGARYVDMNLVDRLNLRRAPERADG
ncbi:MAG: HAD-IA family hydrolase, partial [Gammaproteobacteria bacterium]